MKGNYGDCHGKYGGRHGNYVTYRLVITVGDTVNTVGDTVNTVADTGITFKSLQKPAIISFDTYSKWKRLYEETKPKLGRRRLASKFF